MKYEIDTLVRNEFAMMEKMDSRFRGNDIKKSGNDIGRRDCRAPQTVLAMTEKMDSRFRGNDRIRERK